MNANSKKVGINDDFCANINGGGYGIKVGENMNNYEYLDQWVEIDTEILKSNFDILGEHINKNAKENVKIIAVVKADAYGYGAVKCAQILAEKQVDMLAVTTLNEAVEIREAGVKTPILVFLPVGEHQVRLFEKYDLTATVDGLATLKNIENTSINFHLKVNTGMNRLGINIKDIPDVLAYAKDKSCALTGVYSHLATALEADTSFAKGQMQVFDVAVKLVKNAVGENVMAHLLNSAGALKFPEKHYDAVRLGSVLYGQLAYAKEKNLKLGDPFTAKARIVAVREIAKGEAVGYGRDFVADKAMKIAVVPYGYADGFGVSPDARPATVKSSFQNMTKSVGKVLLNRPSKGVYFDGEFLPVVGRVAMQMSMVDLSKIDPKIGVKVGDVVNVPIRRTATNPRIPRIYK